MKSFRLVNKTPQELRCGPAYGCPKIYQLEECGPIGGCPTIYESDECMAGACPTVYESNECLCGACPTISGIDGKYIVIGKKVDVNRLKQLGLESRVGKDEEAVEVPKALIDKIR